jgi:hypothetical protein
MRPINSDFIMHRPGSEVVKLPRCPSSSLIDCMDRRCRLRRGFPPMLRTLIWPLAFTAMDDAGAAAFRAWPHVESVSDVAATAIVTDHAWPQNLDSVEACEPITLESTSPQRTLRSAAGKPARRFRWDGDYAPPSAGRRPHKTRRADMSGADCRRAKLTLNPIPPAANP